MRSNALTMVYRKLTLMKNSGYRLKKFFLKHLGISPVIGHIILIAIVVVGSSITVVFAQGAYNIFQVSGGPNIELLTVTGFDARDAPDIEAHNAPVAKPSLVATYQRDGIKAIKEVITVFVKNDGTKTVRLDEVTLAGTEYSFSNPLFIVPFGSYAIISSNLPNAVVLASAPELKSGQEVTLIFSLDSSIKVGRSLQFKLVTENGFIATDTVVTGNKKL